MTAIVKDLERSSSPLALVGILVPGLGHLIPGLASTALNIMVGVTRMTVYGRRDAEARKKVTDAEDKAWVFFKRHGDHGDVLIGANLLLHTLLVAWVFIAGGPRFMSVLFGGPADTLDTHAVVAIIYTLATIGIIWFLGWRRARPLPINEEEFNSNRAVFIRTMKRSRNGMLGMLGVFIMISITVVTPFLAPFDPTDVYIGAAQAGPGMHVHPDTGLDVFTLLGTDSLGRDLFSRSLYGARISLTIGFVAIIIAGTIGTSLGVAAGYFGGVVDRSITWFVDLLLSIPRLVLLLAILGIFSQQNMTGEAKLFLIIIVLASTGWMGVSRIVRSQVLSLARQDFIQAARALGLSPLRIMYRHLVPNSLAPVIVYASLAIGGTILVEASLSFLGLGISAPIPTWGSLVSDGRKDLLNSPWLATFPGLLIVWAVLSFNLFGDGLRDALDPRFRGK
ncbi:MAG: peptide/nickel transport system permease protein [Kiritimatiellia bacterium]|jgi:peptide/nickel transport system permease protein